MELITTADDCLYKTGTYVEVNGAENSIVIAYNLICPMHITVKRVINRDVGKVGKSTLNVTSDQIAGVALVEAFNKSFR